MRIVHSKTIVFLTEYKLTVKMSDSEFKMLSGVKRATEGILGGQFEALTKDQLKAIDNAAKDILWRTGVLMPNKEALEILEKAGCVVDKKKEQVWIPPYLVEEAVRKTPKTFRYAGRDPKKTLIADTDRVYFVNGIGPYVAEVDGSLRKPTLKDSQDRMRVLDACEHIDIISLFGGTSINAPESTPEDDLKVPLAVRKVRALKRNLEWSEKPVDMSNKYVMDRELEDENATQAAIDAVNLQIAIRGSLEELRKLPLAFAMNEPVSPLMHAPLQIERELVHAKIGLPIFIGSEPMSNATAPATLAGTLALWTAETLSALVLGAMAAAKEHRSPAVWITIAGQFDQMALTGPQLGAPEGALMQAGCAQIAHYYGFPIRGICESASKVPDAQAGYESAVSLLIMAMGGINFNTSIGTVGPGEIAVNLEKIVLDNELAGYVKRVMTGIEVNEETLAVDVIDEVGPGGTFLAHPHTRKWFRKEQYFPSLFDRRKYEDWVRHGRKDAVQRASERVQEILKDHWPEPLPKDVIKRMEDYIKKVEKREAK
jgi:trimethylamine--corrinoid protein Co-methyltransferase